MGLKTDFVKIGWQQKFFFQKLSVGRAAVSLFGNAHIDFSRFELTVHGQTHDLTTMEVQLLRYFLDNDGKVLSRTQILEDVWGSDSNVMPRTIDNFVLRLRKLIEPNPSAPRHILSVRGTGYRFLTKPEA